MESLNYNLEVVQFKEHPSLTKPDQDEFSLIVSHPFSMVKYCEVLFGKIMQIGLSESAPFLDNQCAKMKNPVLWLNTLEKLIKVNNERFNTHNLQHRHIKLISQIDIKRHALDTPASKNSSIIQKKINGFNEEKEYSFTSVKEQLSGYDTFEEKISLLQDHIYDYQQNPPDYVSMKAQPFVRQCELEIERLQNKESLMQKASARKNSMGRGQKLPFNGDLKVLCDVYFKLIHKKARNGKPILPWTIAQATDHICNSYCDENGAALSASTVRTYLSPSKFESRPKTEFEISID
jgi:hypothetical protein